jgi:hypothetical protein
MNKALLAFVMTMLPCATLAQSPTGKVYFGWGGIDGIINCYPNIYRGPDGKMYYRHVHCTGRAMGYSDIGIPLDGRYNNAMRGEARHFRVEGNTIVLY